MLTLSCDIEGCKNTVPMDDGPMLPHGWGVVQWSIQTKGSQDPSTQALIEMYKGIAKSVPGDLSDAAITPALRILQGQEIPAYVVPMKARICPKCLSEKLDFGHIERGF